MSKGKIERVFALGFPWKTFDPFLFCAHHDDDYPVGDERMGPAAALDGRNIGSDFGRKDGWSMYHGDVVPGFPQHPHRGFETVTLARHGYIDHSDSLGARARFGHGDVQWMTAGRGVQHSEMFPLVNRDQGNRTELFQLWLNLPRADKMVDPHFTMLWADTIPRKTFEDEAGRATEVVAVAGVLDGQQPPTPPPRSYAARADANIAIWTLTMAPGAKWTVPATTTGTSRTLYVFRGGSVTMAGEEVARDFGAQVRADLDLELVNGDSEAQLLMLQGRPLGEPVVHYGPFVMNTPQEIQQAMDDYRRTGYGGWPWKSVGPVHDRARGRFAVHADGREDAPW